MPFTISPMLESDIPAFATVDCASMAGWPLAEAMSINSSTPRHELICSWVKQSFSADPSQIYIKATDTDTSEIVAGALWRFQDFAEKEGEEGDAIRSQTTQASAPIEDGGAVEATGKKDDVQAAPGTIGQEMKASWQLFQRTYFPNQPYANLQILITHPSHQRRGAGSLLTAWGCDRADEKGLITVLTSSDAGLRTYLKAGFEVVRTRELDLGPFGVEAIETRRWMIRQPKKTAGRTQ